MMTPVRFEGTFEMPEGVDLYGMAELLSDAIRSRGVYLTTPIDLYEQSDGDEETYPPAA